MYKIYSQINGIFNKTATPTYLREENALEIEEPILSSGLFLH